jgi:HAD superfamily hydrolase (TIGR01509 family)
MSAVRAVLFDLDGVLVDAKDWHYEAFNRALAGEGLKIEYAEHLAHYDGLPTRKKLERLTRHRGLDPALHQPLLALKQRYTVELIEAQCRPEPAARHALETLKLEGVFIGVCSNSIRSSVRRMLELSGIAHLFDIVLSNEDVMAPKPNPEVYLTAMAHLGVQPDETLILEDSEVGLTAARGSGAHILRIDQVSDVNLANIRSRIKEVELGDAR